MHVVSDQLMDSYEADHAAGFPKRFHAWWRETVDPDADTNLTERLIFAHKEEFELVGAEDQQDRFLFLYARALMPDLGDRDYLETMDAIFARVPEVEKMKMLKDIAVKYGHRG